MGSVRVTGTSFAAPFVAAAAGLLVSLYALGVAVASGKGSIRHEADGALDPDRKRMFIAMKRAVLRIGRYDRLVEHPDATLREMARLRPGSKAELLTVRGVGTRKADELGEQFLSVISSPT